MDKHLLLQYLIIASAKSFNNTHRLLEICIISIVLLIFMIAIISYVHKRRNEK